ncbi:MAG: ribonuclease T2 [Methylobacteriaceae bacterium]|nr:ribonuclease T2 [Methylobacteriaceae bacterium]
MVRGRARSQLGLWAGVPGSPAVSLRISIATLRRCALFTVAVAGLVGSVAPGWSQATDVTPAPQAAPPAAPPATGAPAPTRRSSTGTGDFDFYVLALSWSPGFCSTGGEGKAPDQCAVGSKLGFVVHGLWPQYEHGSPQNCGSNGSFPTRAQIEAVRGLYPDDGLARHEWRVHGTCTGKSPTDYFADVGQARQAIVIPDAYAAPNAAQDVATIDVARAFLTANPGLQLSSMAVTCRSGTLEEVRICFTKDLRGFRPCPEVSRNSCRSRQITIPPVR